MEATSKVIRNSTFLKRALTLGSSFFVLLFCTQTVAQEPFRLHLNQFPLSLNPQLQKTSASSYLMGNIHRNLMKFNHKNELVPDLAKDCTVLKDQIQCTLKDNLKWSDGSPLTTRDFLTSYQNFLNPKTGVTRLDLVESLDGALNYYKTQKGSFGVSAKGSSQLIFKTKQPNIFIYHIASHLLAPVDPSLTKFSGPYYPQQPLDREKIRLKSNPYYGEKETHRPDVEFYIIEEDSVALNLYLKRELDFLRRLPTALISKYRKSVEFHWIPLLRSDYIGFQADQWPEKDIRKSLTQALEYKKLQSLFQSDGTPGCLGFPADWFHNQTIPCYELVAIKDRSLKNSNPQKTLFYSASGGEDHKRAMEWIQSQWKKHLNFNISVRAIENKTFSAELKTKKYPLFRRGVPIEIPNCGEALKYFTSNHPENFIGFKNEQFDQIIKNFAFKNKEEQKRNCSEAAKLLMDSHLMIPLGQIHFAILAKDTFKGWTINSLNQLDLTNLVTVQTKK